MTVSISVPKKEVSAKKMILYFFLAFCFVFVLKNSAHISSSAYSSLHLCAKSVIPSLFPMAIVSSFAMKTGFVHFCARALDKPSRLLFGVGGEGGVAFVIGILAGYPLGADFTVKLYREGRITKNEAERLLPFCNNAGAAFIISGIGQAIRGNIAEGIAIFASQLMSAIAVGVIMRFLAKGKPTSCVNISPPPNVSLQTAFTKSIEEGASAMMRACSYIVFFSVVCASFDIAFSHVGIILPQAASALLGGFFEIANGCVRASVIPSALGISLTAAMCGWSGVSVIAQSASLCSDSDISLRLFFFGKCLQSVISAAFGYLFALVFAL